MRPHIQDGHFEEMEPSHLVLHQTSIRMDTTQLDHNLRKILDQFLKSSILLRDLYPNK